MGSTEENRKELIDEKPPNPVRIKEENRKMHLTSSPKGYAEEELRDLCICEKSPNPVGN